MNYSSLKVKRTWGRWAQDVHKSMICLPFRIHASLTVCLSQALRHGGRILVAHESFEYGHYGQLYDTYVMGLYIRQFGGLLPHLVGRQYTRPQCSMADVPELAQSMNGAGPCHNHPPFMPQPSSAHATTANCSCHTHLPTCCPRQPLMPHPSIRNLQPHM